MPLDDLAAGLFEIIGRILKHIFIEIILEFVVKLPGYLILKLFNYRDIKSNDSDESAYIIVGVVFWVLVGIILFLIYRT